MAWRREAYQAAARRSVADRVWTDVPALTTPPDEAVADGLVAPVSLTMFERAGAGAGTTADLTLAQTVRSAPGLKPERLAAAWNTPLEVVRGLLRGAPEEPQP
jgi:hypothetical protein